MEHELENKLVELAKSNIEEFAPLYDETVTAVFRYVYAISRNKEQSEDVVSKTYLKAMKSLTTYTYMGRPFKAWLFTIARNLLYNEFTAAKSMQSIDEYSESLADESLEDQLNSLIGEDTEKKLQSLLQTLQKEVQEIFFLKYEEGLSFEEIAEIQQSKVSTVKMRFYRAVEKLKAELA